MKKVGIITFHESDNFGTCLQAYALLKSIQLLGYDPQIINYKRHISKKAKNSLVKRIAYTFKEYGLSNLTKIAKVNEAKNARKEKFEKFRKDYLIYSLDSYMNFEELKTLANEYDAFIVGSDMVWCADRVDDLKVYLLEFADRGKSIAYSPSFGSSEIPRAMEGIYKNGLSKIGFLSCREKSGVELVKELSQRQAAYTVDPTLLLSPGMWNRIVVWEKKNFNYILVYMFEGRPNWLTPLIKKVAKSYSAQVIEIPMSNKQWCAQADKCPEEYGPQEFVTLFSNASFVFTNSYHGLMFSLIYNIPFFAVKRENKRWGLFEDRLTDTLREYNCLDRLIDRASSVEKYDMDYSRICEAINRRSAESKCYLDNALKKVTGNVEVNYDEN